MRWKDFLYFQRVEKLAIILLLILIVLVLILNGVLSYRNSSPIVLAQNEELVREFEEFRQSLIEREPSAPEDRYVRESPSQSYSASQEAAERTRPARTDNRTSTSYPRAEKLAAGETILLNSSDTTEWKKVPGIGSAFASRIVNYRNLLGGFASVDQLREVYGVDNELFVRISPFLEPDKNYRKILINKLEFKELLSHPYLNYKQVQAITNLRKKKGDIESINELAMLDEFTSEDIERLAAYIAF